MGDENSADAHTPPASPSTGEEQQHPSVLVPRLSGLPSQPPAGMQSSSQGPDSTRQTQSGQFSFAAPRPSGVRPYGEQYQYAESMMNPPPELVMTPASPAPAPAAAAAAAELQADGVTDSRVGGADNSGEARSPEGGSKEAEDIPDAAFLYREYPWYRWDKRPPRQRWLVIFITIFGTTGVILAIVGAMGLLAPHNNSAAAAASSTSTSTSGAGSSMSSSAPLGSSTSSPPASATPLATSCPDPSTFVQDVSFLSVEGATSGWSNAYSSQTSAQDCCNHCFASGTTDCAAWIYSPDNSFTPCTVVTYKNGSSTDDRCPDGFAGAIQYSQGGNWTAGFGPCCLTGWAN